MWSRAPAIVFDSQEALQQAFKRSELGRDFVMVVRFQGPAPTAAAELQAHAAAGGAAGQGASASRW